MHTPFTEHELGYLFYPASEPDCPGHPQLEVILRAVPSGRHFDPERASFEIASGYGDIKTLDVRHPWPDRAHYQVCAGRVILEDRKKRIVEAFTYGGDLAIEPGAECSTCRLSSSAPILDLFPDQRLPVLLAVETEILLAERRAAWCRDADAFTARLIAARPFELYLACLEALREKFRDFPVLEDESLARFIHFLNAKTRWLQERRAAQADAPRLADLL